LARWRKPLARHDPGKIVTDLALALAAGGDCLADVAVLRAEPALFGPVASDPTVSRLVDTLAADADRALAAIDAARAAARARVWAAAGLVDAAVAVLEREGIAALTVRAVAANTDAPTAVSQSTIRPPIR